MTEGALMGSRLETRICASSPAAGRAHTCAASRAHASAARRAGATCRARAWRKRLSETAAPRAARAATLAIAACVPRRARAAGCNHGWARAELW